MERQFDEQLENETKETQEKKEDSKGKKQAANRYNFQELSEFCLHVSLLLEAAVPIDE